MFRKKNFIVILYVFFGGIGLLSFQNCSDVDFAESEKTERDSSLDPSGNIDTNGNEVDTERVSEYVVTHKVDTVYPDVDILFVIDESSSMNSILDNVNAGFASIGGLAFPANTQIAVTNMAPAKLDAAGNIMFDTSFYPSSNTRPVSIQPGFMQLVDGVGIANFKNNVSNSRAAKFPEPGCGPWFTPAELNGNGTSCLKAATQISLIGTIQEAGAITLLQLSKKLTGSAEKLFRDGSIVNIVFVSDTHDPGNSYYGQDGAYSAIPTVMELTSAIMENNPNIGAIKFNGIVPLPQIGSALLDDLNVIGDLAATAAEVNGLSAEGLYGFSYLDFIRETQGVAVHVENSDWTTAIGEMVETVGQIESPLLKLSGDCNKLTEVKMNGVLLDSAQYSLLDSKTLKINIPDLAEVEYVFNIRCEK